MKISGCRYFLTSVLAALALIGSSLASAKPVLNAQNWLAIVGDSGVTGAASAADLEPTFKNLAGHVCEFVDGSFMRSRPAIAEAYPSPWRERLSNLEPLTRVTHARSETASINRLQAWLINLGAKLSLKLDTHEHSFGYMVGRGLGLRAEDIVLVGQDGVMIETIAMQFERIYEMETTTLPPLVLLSYTANDMCDVKMLNESVEAWAAKFKASLSETWQRAHPFLKAHARGTEILVLAPFDVVNLLTNQEILTQKVNVEGQGEITCGQLRRGETRFTLSSWMILRMLNLMCPSVTQTHPEDTIRLARLRAVQNAFGDMWKEQIQTLNSRYQSAGLRWHFLDGVRDLNFTRGDVSNDCFHPSVRGHAKIADFILQHKIFKR